MKPKAFLFDLNGTMFDDIGYHLEVWSGIVKGDYGAGISREEVKKNMYGKNEDLLFRVFGKDKFTREQLDEISIEKERRYQKLYKPHLTLLPGLFDFLRKAREHDIKMAIGSAAIPFNIDFVLDNLDVRHYFSAIVSAEDVVKSKPDPETFTKGADILKVDYSSCVVFEDAPKGVEAAMNAGMKCVVLTTMHGKDEFSQFNNVLMFVSDYKDERLAELF
jgi:beta-phosphoglucomutase